MQEQYPDLKVTADIARKTFGERKCFEIDYGYQLNGYEVRDRRVVMVLDGTAYLFTSKEIEALGMTVGGMLDDVVANCEFVSGDLVDTNDTIPYVDVIVLATAANVAGADTASAVQGDIPLAFYVDKQLQYDDSLKEYDPASLDQSDPNAAAAYDKSWHAKFFDASKVNNSNISHYVVKGSDLALETMVEKSGGADNSETTYWSLRKSMEDSYYDQEIDKDPNDSGSGKTVKLMSEVAVTNGLTLEGSGAEDITLKNAWLTIEGTEGKPLQPETSQQAIDSAKGRGEMTIREGATLTNNGALVIYGALSNRGTLVNNGRYNDVIKSNDPDKGAFDYHKGIQVAWKDDVTQNNIEAGSLTNEPGAALINNGDIVLMPGTLENKGLLVNADGANIYSAAATEAVIPITPDPATPAIVSKRVTVASGRAAVI